MHTQTGPELVAVGDNARGIGIRERRVQLGIKSQIQASEESKRLGFNISRDAVMAAEKGEASEQTYQRLDAFYDAFEEEIGTDDEKPAETSETDMITFQISGNFGVSATVKGPVGNLSELEEAAARLVAEMRKQSGPE